MPEVGGKAVLGRAFRPHRIPHSAQSAVKVTKCCQLPERVWDYGGYATTQFEEELDVLAWSWVTSIGPTRRIRRW